jgi:hypothetical protein
MNERLRFVARLPEGEKMAVLCREFDISRKTGYQTCGAVVAMTGYAAAACACAMLF